MADPLLPTDPETYDAPPDTQAILAQMAGRIAAIERERKRIRRADWDTLFRQIRTVAGELITHPFIAGDLEAEARISRMLAAADLEEFALRVTDLEEYVQGKLAYNAAMDALEQGESAPDAAPPPPPSPTATGTSRRVAAHGPSGSDFEVSPGEGPKPATRRGMLRL